MSGIWREDDDEPYRVGGRSSGSGGGGGAAGMRSKPRFTFTEVKLLLDEVKRNRYILLKRFNNGVSAEAKKQTWAEITELINDLGENHREVRQIMKKWADLKCDGKRRIAALRGTNSSTLKKKTLGPVERMVHKILLMAPGSDTNNSDLEWDDDDEMDLKKWQLAKGVPPPPTPAFSYLSTGDNSLILPGGSSFDVSPLSTPEKEPSEFDMIEDDFDDDDKELDAVFSRLPSSGGGGGASSSSASSSLPPLDPLFSSSPGGGEALLKFKPRHTYSRSIMPGSNPSSLPRPPPGPGPPPPQQTSIPVSAFLPLLTSDSSASSSLAPMTTGTSSSGREDAPLPPPASSSSSFATNGTTFHPGASLMSSSVVFPPNPSSSSVFPLPSSSAVFPPPPPHPSYSQQPPHHLPPHHLPPHLLHPPSSAPPPPPPPRGPQLSALAAQSLQQQHASRLLLSQVSHSLGTLAQSVQLLVESQQEFVQESLTMQRETVDILRDFSGTVLAMLGSAGGGGGKPGEKSGSGGAAAGGGGGTAQRPV